VEVGAGTAFVTTGVSVCIGSAAALGKVPAEGVGAVICYVTSPGLLKFAVVSGVYNASIFRVEA
jgi:hypothetical protein